MKQTKRILSVVLCLLMLVAVVPVMELNASASTNGYTRESAAYWMLHTVLGHGWNVDGGGAGYDCKDLALKYFEDVGGLSVYELGHARIYAESAKLPDGWVRRYCSNGYFPQKGDMACWGSDYASGYGHVALVYDVDDTYIYVVEQSSNKNIAAFKNKYRITSPKCFVVPDFVSNPSTPTYANLGDSFYAYIINTATWKHLTNDVNNVSGRTLTGESNQIWFFTKIEDGSYIIKSASSGLCLQAEGTVPNANISVGNYTGGHEQRWLITGDSAKYVLSPKSTDLVLDLSGGSNEEGTNIQLYNSNDTAAQLFQVWKLDSYIMQPGVYTAKNTYGYGTNITIHWTQSLGATGYWLTVYKDGNSIVSENVGDTYEYTLQNSKSGEYTVFVEAFSDIGSWKTAQGSHKFTVKGFEAPNVSTSKKEYKLGTDVSISWTSVEGATGYWLDIYRNGEHIYTGNQGTNLSYTFSPKPGLYQVLVQSYSDAGEWINAYSDELQFKVNEIDPVTVKTNQSMYSPGDNIQITWNKIDVATGYWINIKRDNETIVNSHIGDSQLYQLDAAVEGKYEVVVESFCESKYGWSVARSEQLCFGVANHPSKPELNYSIDKSNNKVTFYWDKTSDTTNYDFRLYKDGEPILFDPGLESLSYEIILPIGNYTANVAAVNTKYLEWFRFSDEVAFEIENHTHNYQTGYSQPATCISNGLKTFTCSCGDSYTETIPVNAANHVNTKNVAATASTCMVKGYTAGVYCNDCKQYISGHAEQPLAAHKTTTQNAKAATCTAEGYTGDQVCTVCKQTISKGTAIAKKAHTLTTVNQKNAGCTTAGYTGDQYCTTCKQTITKGSTVNALGHADADSNGNCTRCGTHIKDVTPSQPSNPQPNPNACKYCGQVHTGPFGWLIKFFHSILAIFKR